MSQTPHGRMVAFQGSYLTPSLEHARVADAMRAGVISCPPDTSMDAVARIMATNHVHAVVVLAGDATSSVPACSPGFPTTTRPGLPPTRS